MKRNFCIQCGTKIETSFQTKFCSKPCWEKYKKEHSLQVSPERQATVFLKSPFTSQDEEEESFSEKKEKAQWKSLSESKVKPQSLDSVDIKISEPLKQEGDEEKVEKVSEIVADLSPKAAYMRYKERIQELEEETANKDRKIELLNRTIIQNRIEIAELKEKLARTIEVCSREDENTISTEQESEIFEQFRETKTPWWKRIFGKGN